MAQASSAQREPSMEEILASIRRIIEENDAADRGQARSQQRAETVQRSVIEVDSFRQETRAEPEPEIEPEPVAQPEIQRHKPLLEEIQAQLVAEAAAMKPRWKEEDVMSFAERLAAAERDSYRRSPDDVAQAIENSRAAREDARALLGIPEPANTARAPEGRMPESLVPETQVPESQVPESRVTESVAHAEPAARPEPVLQQPAEPVMQRQAAPAHEPEPVLAPAPVLETIEPAVQAAPAVAQAVRSAVAQSGAARPGLMSERVERQVAASFSELSEAFVERSRKTFDEIAEQMIAPLLRDWMENNLPTLVERMVREEIERVARGGQ